MRKSNYVMRGIRHKTGISVGRITVYVGGCGHACAQVGVTIQVGVRPYSIGGVKQHWKQREDRGGGRGVGGVGGASECQSSTSARRALLSSQTPQQMFYTSSCGQ